MYNFDYILKIINDNHAMKYSLAFGFCEISKLLANHHKVNQIISEYYTPGAIYKIKYVSHKDGYLKEFRIYTTDREELNNIRTRFIKTELRENHPINF